MKYLLAFTDQRSVGMSYDSRLQGLLGKAGLTNQTTKEETSNVFESSTTS
jgi:hypothetical protein